MCTILAGDIPRYSHGIFFVVNGRKIFQAFNTNLSIRLSNLIYMSRAAIRLVSTILCPESGFFGGGRVVKTTLIGFISRRYVDEYAL